MLDVLHVVPFSAADIELVRDFDYGPEPHQVELATWILNESEQAMSRGTRIWLYANQGGDIVGYGSLGTLRWHFPDADSKKTSVLIIPAVALRREFWGQPQQSDKDARYSSQILRHLLLQAHTWPGTPPAVGLYVHPDNQAAIKLYERFQFRRFHQSYTDPTTNITYLSYIFPLVRD